MKSVLIGLLILASATAGAQVIEYKVEGDGIPESLTGIPGNITRGRTLLLARNPAHCLDCHTITRDKELAAASEKSSKRGPALDGVGDALTPAQLRLSVVDYAQVVPKAEMPSFHKRQSGLFIGKQDREKPVLNAQQIEDVVAYLRSLRTARNGPGD